MVSEGVGSLKWSLFPEQSLEGISAFNQLELGCIFYKIYCFHSTLKCCYSILTFMFSVFTLIFCCFFVTIKTIVLL